MSGRYKNATWAPMRALGDPKRPARLTTLREDEPAIRALLAPLGRDGLASTCNRAKNRGKVKPA